MTYPLTFVGEKGSEFIWDRMPDWKPSPHSTAGYVMRDGPCLRVFSWHGDHWVECMVEGDLGIELAWTNTVWRIGEGR